MIQPPHDTNRQKKLDAIDRLITIMAELRLNCPWDKKQTLQSIRHLTIEEVFELSDAIQTDNILEIEEELGDLLLHIVFYAQIGSETNDFDIASIADTVSEKLVRRHPHIYDTVHVTDEEEVKENWEKIKLQEKNRKGIKESVLGGVPKGLPPIIKAIRLQEKAKGVGFDWPNQEEVWTKLKEEIKEFEQSTSKKEKQEELGDILFSLVNLARHLDINPEEALQSTNNKFKHRFEYIEKQAKKEKKNIYDLTLEEMERFWQEAKKTKIKL